MTSFGRDKTQANSTPRKLISTSTAIKTRRILNKKSSNSLPGGLAVFDKSFLMSNIER